MIHEMMTTDKESSNSSNTLSYIFGYGSLICPYSRIVTAPTLKGRRATPVKIKHLQRQWSVPVGGWSAMGISTYAGRECVGVLLPVNDIELAQFDERELGYDRVMVAPEHVSKIDFLNEQEHYYHDHCYFRCIQSTSIITATVVPPTIWVYVQQTPIPISPVNPIPQSYVDIMLRGCLSISKEFAKDFLLTTKGWCANELNHLRGVTYEETPDNNVENDDDEKKNNDNDNSNKASQLQVYWVNDRHDPLYPRADIEYSQTKAEFLDELLQAHRPIELEKRRHFLGRSSTL